MNLRRLIPAEAAAYRDIRLQALRDHPTAYGSTLADWEDKPLAHFARALETRHIFGAFDSDDALIGLAVYDREKGGNSRHRAFVTAIYVRPHARGQGIARKLLGMIRECATQDGVLQLELHAAQDNTAAIAAYTRFGFCVEGASPRAILHDGTFLDEVFMVCRLDD